MYNRAIRRSGLRRGCRGVVLCLALSIMVGCMARERVVVQSVAPDGWSEAVILDIPNSDTVALNKISVVLRYNSDFRCDSLPLDIAFLMPDATAFRESVVLRPSFPRTATPLSTVESIPYRTHSALLLGGHYLVTLCPKSEVVGVEAIGIEIVKEEE